MNLETLKKIAQKVIKSQSSGNRTTSIVQVQRPEGTRYYKGIGMGSNTNVRNSQATFNALLKARRNPADSVTTRQMKMFKGDKR